MFGTLLDKLTSLFSKNFAVASIPLFAFLLLNGLMAFRVSYRFQQWTQNNYLSQDPARQALLSFGFLLLIVTVSYVLSTLSVFMREVLEGKHFLGDFLSTALSQRFRNRLIKVEKEMGNVRDKLRDLRKKQQTWMSELSDAYQQGRAIDDCHYARHPTLTALVDLGNSNQEITLQQLDTEVTNMKQDLQQNDPELVASPGATPQAIAAAVASQKLDDDNGELLRLIRYAVDKAQAQYVHYLTEFQFDYAGEEIAPTKMGNISRVAPHYAATRYSMNFDIFWTRLQKVVETDATFYSVLQDAKMQVDFLVQLVWYTICFTIIWAIALPCLREAEGWFLIIAIVGPVLAYIWYRIALQNYRAFSDLLRASVDLYRLELLKVLRIPLPANAEQERLVWEMLERRLVYGEHSNIALQNT